MAPKGKRAQHDERVLPGTELDVEQDEDGNQAHRDDEGEPALFLAQAIEFAGPGVVVARRQLYLVGQLLLQILNGGGKIAAAHAELDGNVAAAVLAIDHERAIARFHVGNLADGHPATVRRRQQDAAEWHRGHCEIVRESGRSDRTCDRLQ